MVSLFEGQSMHATSYRAVSHKKIETGLMRPTFSRPVSCLSRIRARIQEPVIILGQPGSICAAAAGPTRGLLTSLSMACLLDAKSKCAICHFYFSPQTLRAFYPSGKLHGTEIRSQNYTLVAKFISHIEPLFKL